MAATTATSYTEVAKLITGYANAFLPEKLSLVNSGAMRVDTDPAGDFASGSTFVQRYRNYVSGDWNTPTANTDSTIDAFSGNNETGVIFRRYKDIGIEDFAKLSSGDLAPIQDMARISAHNAALAMENQAFDLIEGVFSSVGPLFSTHVVNATGNAISPSNIAQAKKIMGEYGAGFAYMFMHPDVFYDSEVAALTNAGANDPNTIRTFQETGMAYAGRYGGMSVILNERVGVTDTTYDTYLLRPGAIMLAYQKALMFEAYRDYRAAAGTDVIRYTVAAALHIPGLTWGGSTPSGLGGVTDAALGLGSNWAKRTNVNDKEIGLVCIKSDATA